MTFGELAQLMTALSALGAMLMSYRNSRKIQEVHLSVNSRLSQLLEATGDAQRAIGAQQERDRANVNQITNRTIE
jgi:hypothetical protein